MTALTLSEAMTIVIGNARKPGRAHSGLHRTRQPVLRGSLEAGTFEDSFFRVPGKGEADRLLKAVKAYAVEGKRAARAARAEGRPLDPAERAATTLTLGAVEVMERLLVYWRTCKGAVYPSYDKLAHDTGLGRATIARALKQLVAAGFLMCQRRFVRVEDAAPGPRRKQTSNAYCPVFAQKLVSALPRWMRPIPVPDDQLQREADRLTETATMLQSLNARDYAKAVVGGDLGAMLARLGAALDQHWERESQKNTPPLHESIKQAPSELA
ncbi:helix-turn-helix domain-containing protein [Sphingomonas crocodyli]|nr:helix-turn-helix domain-containing protein [Sphingomonas crocodyli]